MGQIKLKFRGAVLSLTIELEGIEVSMKSDGNSTWTRTIEDFDIDGDLDYSVHCKGWNKTEWSLTIELPNKEPKTITGVIKKGHSRKSGSITV